MIYFNKLNLPFHTNENDDSYPMNTGVPWRTFDRDRTLSRLIFSVAIGLFAQSAEDSQLQSNISIQIRLDRDRKRPCDTGITRGMIEPDRD